MAEEGRAGRLQLKPNSGPPDIVQKHDGWIVPAASSDLVSSMASRDGFSETRYFGGWP
jgi:hypothetical protein